VAVLAGRALLLVNPASRSGGRLAPVAAEALRRAAYEADVVTTEAPGHGGAYAAAHAEEYDVIFTLGGDGTAMEVVTALSGTGRAVGVLAGGTGNLLARALGIPLDVRRAVPALLKGVRRRIDLGVLADGRRFAITAGTGIDAAMIAGAPPDARRRYGVLAYVASATQAMLHPEPFTLRASVDGTVVEREHCIAAMIVNVGILLDGLLTLGPDIAPDDGGLDLCVFTARSFGDAAAVMGRLVARDFRADPRMTFARGRHIVLDAAPARAVQADGEMIGMTPLVAAVAPAAALLLVPARRAAKRVRERVT
jgi:YegS/Rv2252/BmrU family lipid kinase